MNRFFLRIQAGRGIQIAAVATARKLAVLVWHLLTDREDYRWARPSLVASKERALQLQAGAPACRGQKGAAAAYNVKTLRDQERRVAERAERAYAHFVSRWMPQGPRRGNPSAAH